MISKQIKCEAFILYSTGVCNIESLIVISNERATGVNGDTTTAPHQEIVKSGDCKVD